MVEQRDQAGRSVLAWLRRTIEFCGHTIAWLTLVMVLLTSFIVILRYGFNLGWIWLQEILTYMHVAVFTIAAAWTLQLDGHVRVDIFYAGMSLKRQALVNLLGTMLFLIPFSIFLLVISGPYVAASWSLLEGSREAGGLPLVFVLKSLILVLPGLLLCQGVINVFDALLILRKPEEPEMPIALSTVNRN